MKALFIDDDFDSLTPAMTKITSEGLSCECVKFKNAMSSVDGFQPDIVIMDLMNVGATGDPTGSAGKRLYIKDIWEHRFCPVIFYSANPDLVVEIETKKLNHPFISKIKKGKNSKDFLNKKIQK